MTTDPIDDDLQARFRVLREHDLGTAPDLERLLARVASPAVRTRSSMRPMPAWAAGLGVAAIACGLWLMPGPHRATPNAVALAMPGWRMPTDTLLADAGNPLNPAGWTSLPTAALGRPSFNRLPEIRR